ncbi:hypothetical protein [Salinispira pacifica]|uniref:Uncharacterized protein n=1 Tax=Salinispira pacifica TaxID=1307761 RepID=V5WCS9_9SPIO|nr:hypothetical protein [Salinispira pacifica]AHC13608.1 hypothetical protein L21SP2_0164 [Salinispira pacifica]
MKITRARNYRLYFGNPKLRMLDLALDGGRALFGHTPPGLGKSYKNAISRGLYTDVGTRIHGIVSRELRSLFPGYQPLIFPHRRDALDFLGMTREDFAAADFSSPHELHNGVLVWRPFAAPLSEPHAAAGDRSFSVDFDPDRPLFPAPGSQTGASPAPRVILPVFPQPGENSPQVLMYARDAGLNPKNVPGCPGIALHGLQHCMGLTRRAVQLGSFRSAAKQKYQPEKHRKAMGVSNFLFSEEQWLRFIPAELNYFTRTGPYLIPPGRFPPDRSRRTQESVESEQATAVWKELSRELLQQGILLPPSAGDILVLPAIASQREAGDIRRTLQYIQSRMEGTTGETS